MGSTSKTEIGAACENEKEVIPIRNASIDMGHPYPPTPMQVGKSMSVRFVNNTIKQKHSKSIHIGQDSNRLRTNVETFVEWLANGSPSWAD